jgi:four helix bundle protein
MALINKFEDIIAWQEARKLVKMVYELTSTGNFSKDFGLRDQIRRASVSTMTNIAEGFDCESNIEFARFLVIARRSSVEVQSLLYATFDVGYIDENTLKAYYDQAYKTKGLINALKRSLKTQAKQTTLSTP